MHGWCGDAGRHAGERSCARAGDYAQAVMHGCCGIRVGMRASGRTRERTSMRGQSGANGTGCGPTCGRAIVRAGDVDARAVMRGRAVVVRLGM